MTDPHDQIVLAAIALAAMLAGGLVWLIKNQRDTKAVIHEVNNAVNMVGPGEHRLYDKVEHNAQAIAANREKIDAVLYETRRHSMFWEDFHAKWGRLPEDLDDGTDVVVALRDLRAHDQRTTEQLAEIASQVAEVGSALAQHVEWEMRVKYEGRTLPSG